jgi:hypothetical protein
MSEMDNAQDIVNYPVAQRKLHDAYKQLLKD